MVQYVDFVPIFITCIWAQNVTEYAQSSDANAYARGNVWTYVKPLQSSNLHTSFSLDLLRFSVIHYMYTPSILRSVLILSSYRVCHVVFSLQVFQPIVCMYVPTSIYLPSSQYTTLRIIDYLLTYSMVQSPSWEANWFAASQEITHISQNPKVHYRTHKRPLPVSILDQPNPVHIPQIPPPGDPS